MHSQHDWTIAIYVHSRNWEGGIERGESVCLSLLLCVLQVWKPHQLADDQLLMFLRAAR